MVAPIIQFDDVQVDLRKFEVRRRGRRVHLEKQPFDLLILLLRNPGDLVSRKQIAESLWSPDVFVETDRSINNAIRKIRLALGDDPEHPRFIETVAGRGYRFIASISSCPDSELESISEQVVSPNGQGSLVVNDPSLSAISVGTPVTAPVHKRLPILDSVKWFVLGAVALLLAPTVVWKLRQKPDPGKEPRIGGN